MNDKNRINIGMPLPVLLGLFILGPVILASIAVLHLDNLRMKSQYTGEIHNKMVMLTDVVRTQLAAPVVTGEHEFISSIMLNAFSHNEQVVDAYLLDENGEKILFDLADEAEGKPFSESMKKKDVVYLTRDVLTTGAMTFEIQMEPRKVATLIVGYSHDNFVHDEQMEAISSYARSLMDTIRNRLEHGEMGQVREILEAVLQNSDSISYLQMLNSEGRVIAHLINTPTGNLLIGTEGHIVQDAVSQRALKVSRGKPLLVQKTETASGEPVYDISMPLTRKGKKIGVIRLGYSLSDFEAEENRTRKKMYLGAFLFIMGCLGIAGAVAFVVTRPVRTMASAAEMAAAGDLNIRVDPSGSTRELNQLASSFNSMIAARQKAEFQITRHRDSLEDEVKRRTAQLERANESLENEIKERESAENALRESEERLKLALEASEDGLWDWDMETDRVYYSPRWKEMLGFENEEVKDSIDLWMARVHEDDLPDLARRMGRCLDGSRDFYESEFRMRTNSGEWIWIMDRGKVVERSEDGKALRMVGTHKDITQRKKTEQKLQKYAYEMELKNLELEELSKKQNELNLRLGRQNEELEAFAHTVSHDLKSPISSVMTYSEMLRDEWAEELGDMGGQMLDSISNAVTNSLAMIEDLLDFSRSGFIEESSMEDCRLHDLVNQALEILKPAIDKRGIKITVHPENPILWGDRIKLVRVFENLIGNAVKYIGAENESPAIEIGLKEEDEQKVFFVRDNGIGIGEKYRANIFNLFNRGTGEKEAEGSGAGLAIVKRIVEAHNGSIDVKSEPGEGSTFLFTIGEVS